MVYGLSSEERIKSRKEIEKIFTEGRITRSFDNKIRANYFIIKEFKNQGVMIAVAVSKKSGNAVWRNRVKRLIKEAYRLNKPRLIEKCRSKNILLKIIFSPQTLNQKTNSTLFLKDVENSVRDIASQFEAVI